MAKRVLSIEIGLQQIKLCEVDYGKKNPHVYNCLIFDTPDNTIDDGYIRDKTAFSALLKNKIKESRIKVTDVVFTISSSKIANREVIIPLVKEEKIHSVIESCAQDYFPVDVSEYAIAYSILEKILTKEEKKYKLLLLLAPNSLIKNYYGLAEALGYHVEAIDYIGNSFSQLISRQMENGVNIAIQIGEQTTLINVIDNEKLVLQRSVPYGIKQTIDTVIDNQYFGKSNDKDAIELLSQEVIINNHFDSSGNVSPTMSFTADVYDKVMKEIQAKEEVTESLHFLVNNIIRVLDYYNSRYPDRKINYMYVCGLGSKFKGLSNLFQNEIGLEVKILEKLFAASFSKNIDLYEIDQTELISCIGATIKPVGFILDEIIAQKEKRSSVFSMGTIAAMSVLLSIVLIIISSLNLNTVKKEKQRLQSAIDSKQYIQGVFDEYNRVLADYNSIAGMYSMTENKNEQLNELITELEEKLPATMRISNFSSDSSGFSMNITTTTKMSVAKLLMQLESFDLVASVSVPSVVEEQDENGIKTVTFYVLCNYNNNTVAE